MTIGVEKNVANEVENSFEDPPVSFNVDSRLDISNFKAEKDNIKRFDVDDRLKMEIHSNGLEECIRNFNPSNWFDLEPEEMAYSINELKIFISDKLNLKNIPSVEFYEKEDLFNYGFYDTEQNYIGLNVYNFDNPIEIANTIIHELRHRWQVERINLPEGLQTDFDKILKFNDENYVAPEDNYRAYWIQPMEIDAREFANNLLESIKE